MRKTLIFLLLALATSLAFTAGAALAATPDNFVGSIDNTYENAGNWSSGWYPGSTDAAYIAGYSVTLSAYLSDNPYDTPAQLAVGWNGNGGTLTLNYGSRVKTLGPTYIGYNSSGSATTNGQVDVYGWLSSGGTLVVGSGGISGVTSGTLNVYSGGTVEATNVGGVTVGSRGTGIVNLSGGNLNVTSGQLLIGSSVGNGAVTVDNGSSVSATGIKLGSGGTGTGALTLNNGNVSTSGTVILGAATSAPGSMTINSGWFNQTGGSFSVGSSYTGTLDMSGGLAYLPAMTVGDTSKGTGTVTIANGAALSVSGAATLGYRGVGTFTQNGGSVSFGQLLYGYATSDGTTGNGTYNLNGGVLTLTTAGSTVQARYGAAANLNIAGGTFATSYATIGTLSNFNFSGGTLQNAAAITGPVTLTSGSGAVFQQDSTCTVSGAIGGTGTLTTTGGTLLLTGANTYSGKTTVQSGTLQMTSNAYGNLLSHATDVQGGQLVFDYDGGTTPTAAIRSTLHSSAMYTSTGAAAGYVVGYNDDGLSKVTAKVALSGDTDLGGVVNNDDLARLLSALGGTDCVWQQGDFNYDGKVNNDDLAMLLSNLGKTFAGFGSATSAHAMGGAVPEPSTLALLTAGLAGLIAYAWRKRK
ncbi:MAG: autotransporter-associated beta strand repeat-containing protein [Thermoguttaceae bacterium]